MSATKYALIALTSPLAAAPQRQARSGRKAQISLLRSLAPPSTANAQPMPAAS
ncbi:hypothetical protein V6L77_14240 [Pannonibacter sp. Pt2-lr]